VSRVQRLRKEAGYAVSTRIVLAVDGGPAVRAAAEAFRDYLAGETLARELVIGGGLDDADRAESVQVDDNAVALAVRRHGNGRTGSGPAQVDGS